ncbi:MAG: hypothetical protein K2Y23_02560 [Cyanobacteria bacterium]|nr:hypothetical protein [Cyanobacteriota bacterium]
MLAIVVILAAAAALLARSQLPMIGAPRNERHGCFAVASQRSLARAEHDGEFVVDGCRPPSGPKSKTGSMLIRGQTLKLRKRLDRGQTRNNQIWHLRCNLHNFRV